MVDKWTDWFTDELFDCNSKATSVRFGLSRFVVDAERLVDDPMENIGQGIVYSRFGEILRTGLTDAMKGRLMGLYRQHIDKLKVALSSDSLLIDCHSFPHDLYDVDVCIGTNEDWSKPSKEVLETAIETFTACGYSVEVNRPYSNSVSPDTGFHYQSIMVELNKSTYMKSETEKDEIKFRRMRETISEQYDRLVNA